MNIYEFRGNKTYQLDIAAENEAQALRKIEELGSQWVNSGERVAVGKLTQDNLCRVRYLDEGEDYADMVHIVVREKATKIEILAEELTRKSAFSFDAIVKTLTSFGHEITLQAIDVSSHEGQHWGLYAIAEAITTVKHSIPFIGENSWQQKEIDKKIKRDREALLK